MDSKVIIASDSTCDLSPELIEKYRIKILPLLVNLGGSFYQDGVEITPDMIYKHYEETGELPTTSAANIADFQNFFDRHTSDGSSLVFFTISSGMSSTYDNACLAADAYENVHVVDTGNLSTGGGLLVLAGAQMAEEGKTAADIAASCSELAEFVDASFIVNDLKFLHKGGRCSALEALGANLLHIKPCIQVAGKTLGVGKKYRGKFSSVLQHYIANQLGDLSDIDMNRIFVTHAGCSDEICDQCVAQVKEIAPFKEVLLTRAGCTISSHCGRNTLGILFIRNTPVSDSFKKR